MKILIGCESSGTIRREFRNAGHDAWSCDLLPPSKDRWKIRSKTFEGIAQAIQQQWSI